MKTRGEQGEEEDEERGNVLILGGKGGGRAAFTRNLVPGKRVYDEQTLTIGGKEYRRWDPYRSKLAGAMLKGLPKDVVAEGDRVLYLGTSTGTTASHVSDIIGPEGLLIGVELSVRVGREFLENVARVRTNIIPYIADARDVEKFAGFGKVDVVYCDIAQRDQTEIAIENCVRHLRAGGRLILVIKARSISGKTDPKVVFRAEAEKLRNSGFGIESMIDLNPYDRDHALISARQALRPLPGRG